MQRFVRMLVLVPMVLALSLIGTGEMTVSWNAQSGVVADMVIGALGPAPLAAQVGWCGECTGVPGVAHVFTSISPSGVGGHKCDNSGGCHFDWYFPGCSVHGPCFAAEAQGEVGEGEEHQPESHVGYGDRLHDELSELLARGEQPSPEHSLWEQANWKWDPASRTVMLFNCAEVLVARFPVRGETETARLDALHLPRKEAARIELPHGLGFRR